MGGEVSGSVMILSIEITAVPDTFGVLQNQVNVDMPGGVVMADTTSKQSGGFETGLPLLKNANITFEYNPDPTDQAHIDLQAHWDANPMTTFKIELLREDGVGKVAGTYGLASFGPKAPVTDIVRIAGELVPVSAPTLT